MAQREKDESARPCRSIEASGGSVEQAIEVALSRLGVARSRVRVDVLEEGQKGLFGLRGAKEARIRATVIEEG